MTQFKAIDSIKMGEGTRNYCLCERTSIIVTKIVSQRKKVKRGHFCTQEAISTHQKVECPWRLLHTHLPYSGLNQWSMEIKRP